MATHGTVAAAATGGASPATWLEGRRRGHANAAAAGGTAGPHNASVPAMVAGAQDGDATAAPPRSLSGACAAGDAEPTGEQARHHPRPRRRMPHHRRLVALFGSSLNPVTRAHVAIVQALLDERRVRHTDDAGLLMSDYATAGRADSDPGPGRGGGSGGESLGDSGVDGVGEHDGSGGGGGDGGGGGGSACGDSDPGSDVDDPAAEPPLFDEVWVAPVFSHPDVEKYRHLCDVPHHSPEQREQFEVFLKKKALRDSFDDRVSLCRAAFSKHPRVKIKTYERDLWRLFPTYRPAAPGTAACHVRTEAEHYPGTLHLVRWMVGVERYEGDSTFAAEQAAGTEYAWFMGQDTWESYVRGGWVGKFELQTRVRLVNAPRDGVLCGPLVPVPGTKPPIALDHLDVLPTSSTAARHAARNKDGKALRKQVPESVARLIEDRDMFEVMTPRI